jgi:lipid-A-disaccharide synthase
MSSDSEKHIFFLTGELSGDMHAAELLKSIHKQRPKWRFTAIGSDHLQAAGAEIWYDSLRLGAIGIYEAIKRAWPVLQLRNRFIRELPIINPDLIVAVDYRALNISLLHAAHRLGYRSAYYIAPVTWGEPSPTRERRAYMRALSVARRSRRVREQTKDRFRAVADVCDVVILIYPICEDEYRDAGANVHYVGHPLVNIIEGKLGRLQGDFQRAEELAELTSGGAKLIGVLPGSRLHEFKHHCPVLRKVVRVIRDAFPKTTFFLPLASPRLMLQLERYWPGVRRDCRIIGPDEYDWYAAAHLLITKSGTAVQTGMVLGTPMVAVYRVVSEPFYRICKALFYDRELWTFPNVLAGRQVIPEFIQSDFNAENVAGAVLELLRDDDARRRQRAELKALRDMLYRPDSLERSAQLIIDAAEGNSG